MSEKRLIDANSIYDKVEANYRMSEGVQHECEREFLNLICDAPTVDAVPVRCKDCKHNIGEKVWLDGEVTIDCANGMGYPPPDWFCADGERRTDEQQT